MNNRYHIIFLTLLSNFLIITAFSQQGNIWYFGYNAGLNFNTSPPSPLFDGKLNTLEGSSSIADENGRYLFSTDGGIVYNQNNTVMKNGTGLKGSFSAAQSALIVQQPGSDNLYYIFTANSQAENVYKGYNYSIVDMTADNGLGEVVQKNVFLYAPCTERLTAVRHANGIDVWIITNELGTNRFMVYKLDCNGFDPNPIVSAVGLNLGTRDIKAVGHIKASPDGKILCQTISHDGVQPVNAFQLFHFDNTTGLISDAIQIPSPRNYGCEFSPDSKLVYVSTAENPSDRSILQFSVAVYDAAVISNSKYIVTKYNDISYSGALQLGPDNKIYHAKMDSTNLAVINNPNIQGPGCNFVYSGIKIGGKSALGLPTFFGNYLVTQNAAISFTPDANCSAISFQGTTTIAGAVTWLWEFGDGTSSTDQNPVHTFPNTINQYKVRLTVKPASGCGKAVANTSVNLIRPLVKAAFTSAITCGNLTVPFTDKSTISVGNINSWEWDFGDGTTSTDQHPVHNFTAPGNYPVKLAVTYNQGCVAKDMITYTINLEAKPVAGFTTGNACVNKSISFSDASVIAMGNINKWYWIFGDNSTSALQNPDHTYSTAGTFRVKLVATSQTGCISDTAEKLITVDAKPTAAFTHSSTCIDSIISFHNESNTAVGTIDQWYWNTGDGTSAITRHITHQYSQAGNFIIKMVALTSQQCTSDTLIRSIQVDAKPVASFSLKDGCVGIGIIPVNNSTIITGNLSQYYWDLQNGIQTTTTPQQPLIFTEPGVHSVKMVAKSQNGCISDTASQTVTIESNPVVDLGFGNTCAGKEIKFANLSNNDYGAVTKWEWNFGNGDGSKELAPAYTYYKYGNYNVTLTATTSNGCNGAQSKTVSIARVNVHAGNDTIAAARQPVQLTATGAAGYVWWPANYLNDPLIGNPVSIPSETVTYYLTGTTAEGCIGYDTLLIKVYKAADVFVPNAFAPNGKNRIFRPILAGIQQLYYFSVYNKWGQMIFTTKEPGKGWDGTLGGKPQPADTFVWILKAKDYTGKMIDKKGTVILIR